jgi:hypothetical protein
MDIQRQIDYTIIYLFGDVKRFLAQFIIEMSNNCTFLYIMVSFALFIYSVMCVILLTFVVQLS